MQRSIPIIAIATITTLSLAYFIFKKITSKQSSKPSSKSPSKRPQSHFKSKVRDNHSDNSHEFYTQAHYESVKLKIESLNPQKTLFTLPNLSPRAFQPDPQVNDFIWIDTPQALERLTDDIVANDSVIGWDIEQTNLDSYQGYNCLIQISRLHQNYIIDAIVLHDVLAESLKRICEKEDLVKVFYAGGSDLLWLCRDYGVFVVNYFDVQLASMFLNKKNDSSLPGLVSEYCNYQLDRVLKKKLQASDWRTRPLSQDQLNYAALDAHYLIYLRNVLLEKIKKEKEEEKIVEFIKQMQAPCMRTYPMRTFSIDSLVVYFDDEMKVYKREHKQLQKETILEKKRIFLTLCALRDRIARKADTNPENVTSNKSLFDLVVESSNSALDNLANHLEHLEEVMEILQGKNLLEVDLAKKAKTESVDKNEAKAIRKKLIESMNKPKDVYEECKLLAPDGEFLCFTNRKKIDWYLTKGIGTLVEQEPPVLKLNFEPSNRGYSDMRDLGVDRSLYEGQNRKNQCVICGQREGLLRYHVVPLLYRQYFPLEMKAHRGHDVLLLCERCLEKANKESHKFKDELASRYGVPLMEFDKPQSLKNLVDGIKKTLISLFRHRDVMPVENRIRIEKEIQEQFEEIREEEGIVDEFREGFKKFEMEDGKVKITEEFFEYFKAVKNPKTVVKKASSNKEFKNMHGKIILEKFQTQEELKGFIEEWRMFFIRTLDPQFLPYDWQLALDRRIEKNNN